MWMVATDSVKCNWVFDTFKEAKEFLDAARKAGENATIHKLNYAKKQAYA